MIDKKHFSTLIILVILRLLFVVYSTNFDLMLFTKDSFHYINLSENISQSYFEQNIENYWINTFRLIGYPVFISFFRQFINLENVVYTNLIFDLLSCVLVYKIIYKIKKDEFLSFLGAFLFLLNPNVLISSTQIMTENLSMFLLLITVFLLTSQKTSSVIFSGISLGLFSLVKPFGIYVLIFIIISKIFIFKTDIKKILLFSVIPLSVISLIYLNNFQNYGTSFYSTSSYFHLQWFNDASDALCKDFDFNQERVSEPGYRFEEWKLENKFNSQTEPKIFIDNLKLDSQDGTFQNIQCKLASIIRSTTWNLFGIRGNNWDNSFIEQPYLQIVKLFSLLYVVLINLIFIVAIFFKKDKSDLFYLLLIVFYLAIISLLPYGNARTRVLIEPYLIIIFACNVQYLIKNTFKKT